MGQPGERLRVAKRWRLQYRVAYLISIVAFAFTIGVGQWYAALGLACATIYFSFRAGLMNEVIDRSQREER